MFQIKHTVLELCLQPFRGTRVRAAVAKLEHGFSNKTFDSVAQSWYKLQSQLRFHLLRTLFPLQLPGTFAIQHFAEELC